MKFWAWSRSGSTIIFHFSTLQDTTFLMHRNVQPWHRQLMCSPSDPGYLLLIYWYVRRQHKNIHIIKNIYNTQDYETWLLLLFYFLYIFKPQSRKLKYKNKVSLVATVFHSVTAGKFYCSRRRPHSLSGEPWTLGRRWNENSVSLVSSVTVYHCFIVIIIFFKPT